MKIGDLIRIKWRWSWIYPEYRNKVGLVTYVEVRDPKTNRVQFLIGDETVEMSEECLEVI